jgi:hypothetical protein
MMGDHLVRFGEDLSRKDYFRKFYSICSLVVFICVDLLVGRELRSDGAQL